MKILFLGDIVGRSGRDAITLHLKDIRQRLKPDMVIANGENAAGGVGITAKIGEELCRAGVDVITLGNHAFDQRHFIAEINSTPHIIRPINYPEGTAGKGYIIHAVNNKKILVINAMCRVFMEPLECPFKATEKLLAAHPLSGLAATFIDLHGEASSEKIAFAHHFDGQVTAVVGTHTHVPSADARLLPKGTGFQNDAGMCGDYDSVIGVKKDVPIARFTKRLPTDKMEAADGPATLCGTWIEVGANGLCKRIAPFRFGPHLANTWPDTP